jgi:hypothetical protein
MQGMPGGLTQPVYELGAAVLGVGLLAGGRRAALEVGRARGQALGGGCPGDTAITPAGRRRAELGEQRGSGGCELEVSAAAVQMAARQLAARAQGRRGGTQFERTGVTIASGGVGRVKKAV